MSKAAQRQANYREFCEKQLAYLRDSLADKPDDAREAYLADFQKRLDKMFTRVPSIADNEANFDNACKHIAYQMAIESDELTDEQKAQFTDQRLQQIGAAPKNWVSIIVIAVILMAAIVIITQLPNLL